LHHKRARGFGPIGEGLDRAGDLGADRNARGLRLDGPAAAEREHRQSTEQHEHDCEATENAVANGQASDDGTEWPYARHANLE
jgi:hypothetical protein